MSFFLNHVVEFNSVIMIARDSIDPLLCPCRATTLYGGGPAIRRVWWRRQQLRRRDTCQKQPSEPRLQVLTPFLCLFSLCLLLFFNLFLCISILFAVLSWCFLCLFYVGMLVFFFPPSLSLVSLMPLSLHLMFICRGLQMRWNEE